MSGRYRKDNYYYYYYNMGDLILEAATEEKDLGVIIDEKLKFDKHTEAQVNKANHTCQPREKFWRDKRGATERSEPTSEGGPGGTPPENFKNLHCKWCNLCYS